MNHACTRTPLYQLVHEIWSAYIHQLQQRYDRKQILKNGLRDSEHAHITGDLSL